MNYHRIPNKYDFPSSLLISTPGGSTSASNLKLPPQRHEKSVSLLKLPPIKASRGLLPAKRNDFSTILPEKYKSLTPDTKDSLDSINETSEFTGSPLKRILLNSKAAVKENKTIEPHQRNLKENNGFLFEIPSEFKLKSPMNERSQMVNIEKFRTPKSEQMKLPKMGSKPRLDALDVRTPGGSSLEEGHKNPQLMLNSLKQRENHHFHFFFNPSLLLSDQLIEKEDLPRFEPSKCSSKKNGVIKAYAANTHQGLIRNYNEDRVAIILNIVKPPTKKTQEWPSCSFFAIYDGHGGSKCAEFLRDNLHHYIIKDSFFPANPKMAIKRGIQLAEKTFLEQAQQNKDGLEKSGSCAILVLIVNDMCYIANVGDSRAILSNERGGKIIPLSLDHKPGLESEKKRVLEAGGQIYQSQTATGETLNGTQKIITGPFRVLPGRLSGFLSKVSRTFGDAEAKLEEYGGNPKVIVADPDIKSFRISEKNDFILLGCDGIFDKLSNVQVTHAIWETMCLNKDCKSLHEFAGKAVENMMKQSLCHKSLDNITAVMICLKNLKKTLFSKKNKNVTYERKASEMLKKIPLVEMSYFPEDFNEKDNLNPEINPAELQPREK